MEPLPQEIVAHRGGKSCPGAARSCCLLATLLLGALAAGCESSKAMLLGNPPRADSSHPVCQVVTAWSNQVVYTPDPVHNGTPTPGFAGRLYLFGEPVGAPLVGDGSVVVDLYDETNVGPDHAAVHLEEWRIDKDTLKRLMKRDAFGYGYTLFLPWGTCKPGVTKVTLKARYEPPGATPLYAACSPMTLNNPQAGLAAMPSQLSQQPVPVKKPAG